MIAKDMFVLWTFMTSSHVCGVFSGCIMARKENDFAVEDRAAPTTIRRAISDYFSGDLCAVNSIPVTTGGTSFQREVWAALKNDRSRHKAELWGVGATVGPSEIRPCGWLGQWRKPGCHCGSVPPGHWR